MKKFLPLLLCLAGCASNPLLCYPDKDGVVTVRHIGPRTIPALELHAVSVNSQGRIAEEILGREDLNPGDERKFTDATQSDLSAIMVRGYSFRKTLRAEWQAPARTVTVRSGFPYSYYWPEELRGR